MPKKTSSIHNGLEGWEALKWGYRVITTMLPLTEMVVDRNFVEQTKQGFDNQDFR